jgi:hypothetical protein
VSVVGGRFLGMDWTTSLAEQIDWHWQNQARPRVDGLTDREYLWEPVADCWSIRPRAEAVAMAVGTGDAVIDFDLPEPSPAPVTTIAWRLAHVIVGVLGERNARYFDGPPVSYQEFDYPASADRSLALLDAAYDRWIDGVRALSPEALEAPCGEPGFEASPMADLVLHIHRELIHHLAEVALLRDLYLRA